MQYKTLQALLFLSLAICSKAVTLDVRDSDDDEYDEEVEEAIDDGRTAYNSIPNPQTVTDSTISCDINQYGIDNYIDGGDVTALVSGALTAGNINLGGNWHRLNAYFPKNDPSKPTHFDCGYNANGAIVFMDIARDSAAANRGPYSAADVSWAVYKALVDENSDGAPGQNDYSNIRYIFHTDLTSDNSAEVLEDFGTPQGQVQTYQPGSDGFNAFMGLDNGAVVVSLLRFHNVEMGRKRIQSIGVYVDANGQGTIWFVLG